MSKMTAPSERKSKVSVIAVVMVLDLCPNCPSRVVTLSDTEKKSRASQIQASHGNGPTEKQGPLNPWPLLLIEA